MNRAKLLKRVNAVLFFFLIFQALTALLIGVLGDAFEILHPAGGGLLVVVGLVHLGLNWGWVRSTYLSKKK